MLKNLRNKLLPSATAKSASEATVLTDPKELVYQPAFQNALRQFDTLFNELLDARKIDGEVELEARKLAYEYVQEFFLRVFGEAFPTPGGVSLPDNLESQVGVYFDKKEDTP